MSADSHEEKSKLKECYGPNCDIINDDINQSFQGIFPNNINQNNSFLENESNYIQDTTSNLLNLEIEIKITETIKKTAKHFSNSSSSDPNMLNIGKNFMKCILKDPFLSENHFDENSVKEIFEKKGIHIPYIINSLKINCEYEKGIETYPLSLNQQPMQNLFFSIFDFIECDSNYCSFSIKFYPEIPSFFKKKSIGPYFCTSELEDVNQLNNKRIQSFKKNLDLAKSSHLLNFNPTVSIFEKLEEMFKISQQQKSIKEKLISLFPQLSFLNNNSLEQIIENYVDEDSEKFLKEKKVKNEYEISFIQQYSIFYDRFKQMIFLNFIYMRLATHMLYSIYKNFQVTEIELYLCYLIAFHLKSKDGISQIINLFLELRSRIQHISREYAVSYTKLFNFARACPFIKGELKPKFDIYSKMEQILEKYIQDIQELIGKLDSQSYIDMKILLNEGNWNVQNNEYNDRITAINAFFTYFYKLRFIDVARGIIEPTLNYEELKAGIEKSFDHAKFTQDCDYFHPIVITQANSFSGKDNSISETITILRQADYLIQIIKAIDSEKIKYKGKTFKLYLDIRGEKNLIGRIKYMTDLIKSTGEIWDYRRRIRILIGTLGLFLGLLRKEPDIFKEFTPQERRKHLENILEHIDANYSFVKLLNYLDSIIDQYINTKIKTKNIDKFLVTEYLKKISDLSKLNYDDFSGIEEKIKKKKSQTVPKAIKESFDNYKNTILRNQNESESKRFFEDWIYSLKKLCIKKSLENELIDYNFTKRNYLKFLNNYGNYPTSEIILSLKKSFKIFKIQKILRRLDNQN